MDLTSSKEYSVIVLIVWFDLTPLTLIASLFKKVPLVDVKLREVAPLAAAFKYPLAPLLAPSIKDPSIAVSAEVNVKFVYVCISHKNNSYFVVTSPYLSASNLKSYTLARPISLPAAFAWVAPILWSLKLRVWLVPRVVFGAPYTRLRNTEEVLSKTNDCFFTSLTSLGFSTSKKVLPFLVISYPLT